MLLVTTALESTWGSNEPILFLGGWCRLYARREIWEKRIHHVATYHWDDRDKLFVDQNRLKMLHEKLLEALSISLNNYHGIDRSPEYWRIILDPWLLSYVAVVWDRWEAVRSVLINYDNLVSYALPSKFVPEPPAGYNEFIEAIQTDIWNHHLFLDLIRIQGGSRVSILDAPSFGEKVLIPKNLTLYRQPESLRRKLFLALDRVLNFFFSSELLLSHFFILPAFNSISSDVATRRCSLLLC